MGRRGDSMGGRLGGGGGGALDFMHHRASPHI